MTEEIKKLIIYTRKMKKREPLYRDYPEEFREEIRGYLESNHISRLYAHQVEMFEKVRAGENVVITTSTASGKTLAFLLPVLQEILEDPLTRAIFIYPTKALASDQYRAMQSRGKSFSRRVRWRYQTCRADKDPQECKYYPDQSGDAELGIPSESQQLWV